MKFLGNKRSLIRRYSYATILVVTLILLVFSSVAILYSIIETNKKITLRLSKTVSIARGSLPSALWNLEEEIIKDLGETLCKEEGIDAVVILDDTGEKFFEKFKGKYKFFVDFREASFYKSNVSEIKYLGQKVGTVQVAISRDTYMRALIVNIVSIVLLTVILIFGGSLTSIFVTRKYVFQPLTKLEHSAASIAEGDLETEIDTSSEDEIGNLARAFDGMRKSVKQLVKDLKDKNKALNEAKKTLEKEVKKRTADLTNSQQMLKIVLDNIERRIYWKNIKGIIVGGNRVFLKDLGLNNPEELYGKTESDLWKRREVAELFEGLSAHVTEKNKAKVNVTEAVLDNSGERKWFDISCTPLKDSDDKITTVLCTYRDITNAKQTEEELRKAKDEAERANKAKDKFLANVSHEIRTPMNSIIGFTEQILKTNLTSKQKNYLMRLDSSAHYLLRIINDILDFSRMELGELDISNIGFPLKNVLENVESIFYDQAEQKCIKLRIKIINDVPVFLIGDEDRLKQILNNLVGNAIRYTKRGQVNIEVSCLEKRKDSANILFSVRDTGCGIPEKDKEKIFLPYEQLNVSSISTARGIGLGLTIAQQLVTLMGGKIDVTSEIGKGSTFYFVIPFKFKSEKRKTDIYNKDITKKDLNFACLNDLYILLAEDDDSSRYLLKDILEQAGIRVDEVKNGKEAIKAIKSTPYDIVLLDMQMPEVEGYEVCEEIRKDPRVDDLTIIAVTAHAIVGDRKKCIDSGANDYISKPINSEQLLLTIKKWVQQKGKISSREKIKTQDTLGESSSFEFKESLDGLDIKDVSKRLKIDTETFKRSLKAFEIEHTATIENIKSYLVQKNYKEANKQLHTLIGSAGNIAAKEVETVARDLKSALEKGDINLEMRAAKLEAALEKVLESIRTTVNILGREKILNHSKKKDKVNSVELKPLITRLEKLLIGNNIDALSIWDQLKEILFQTNVPENEILLLNEQIVTLDYKAAYQTLRKMTLTAEKK